MKRFFFIKLSNGLGNNLFQIVSSLLLFRDYSNVKFFLITPEKDYYALPVIKKLFKSKINFSIVDSSPFFYILINDKTYKIFKYFSIFLKIPFTYLSNGYFEDYRYYINDLELYTNGINRYKIFIEKFPNDELADDAIHELNALNSEKNQIELLKNNLK